MYKNPGNQNRWTNEMDGGKKKLIDRTTWKRSISLGHGNSQDHGVPIYIYIFLFQTVSSDCFGCQGGMRFGICPQCIGEIMPLTVLDHKYYWPCPGRLYTPLKKAERCPSSHLIRLVAIPFGQHACKCVCGISSSQLGQSSLHLL